MTALVSPIVRPPSRSLRAPSSPEGRALLTGLAVLFAGYAFAFAGTLDQSLGRSLSFAAINTTAAGLAALLFLPVIARLAVNRPRAAAVVIHPVLAAAFALAWYFCTMAGYGLTPDWAQSGLRLAPFASGALSWQIFQGVTVYAVLALFVHWRAAVRALDQRSDAAPGPVPAPRPAPSATGALLIRCDREVVPVLPAEIVRITGADGYSEVITRSRRLLSVSPLARFEEMLPRDQFVRAHRSHIVRLSAVEHAEPAGNARLLLHLEDGARIMTSRAGARRLRELTV